MPVKFGSILHLNNSGSEATLDANNLRGTTIQIDSFNSASLAQIGSGLSSAPGKRRLGTIVATTGSAISPVKYYAYIQTSSGDPNLSGSEWTTLSNWEEIQLGTPDPIDLSALNTFTGSIQSEVDAIKIFTGSIQSEVNALNLFTGSIQSEVDALNLFTGSIQSEVDAVELEVDALNLFTGSIQSEVDALNTFTGSIQSEVDALNLFTGSIQSEVDALESEVDALNTFTGSIQTEVDAVELEVDALNIFTGSIQTEVDNLTAATSSYLLNTTDTFTGTLTVVGDIVAENYIVSSSVTYMTQSFSSGSTIFGDTLDDTHQFTGSVDITGSITASGNVRAYNFIGQYGTNILQGSNGDTDSIQFNNRAHWRKSNAYISSRGNEWVLSGNGIAEPNDYTEAYVHIAKNSGGLKALSLDYSNNGNKATFDVDTNGFLEIHPEGLSTYFSGSITASGNISASGDLTANNINAITSLTASGIIYPTTDGDNGDVLITDGAGNLSFNRTVVYANVKNVSGVTLAKGWPVHATASAGNASEVIAASASDATTMPATYILAQELDDEEEGLAILTGYINGVDTSLFEEGQVLYVGADGGYTNVKPTGSNLIQNLGIVAKSDANGSGYVYGSGRSNDVPNITPGYAWVGNSDSVATAVATSSFVVDNANTASYVAAANIDGTIDISDQTNLAGGTNLTLSGDTMNLNANISLTSITASGDISASGTIHAGLSTGTSNTVVILDNGELKTDNVDSKIFGSNLVNYTATLSPVTPDSNQLAIWDSAGTIRGYDGLTASPNGTIIATTITASLSATDISYIGYLDVDKLRINGVIVGQYISNNTVLGNAVDTKTIIESPKLEVNDLDSTKIFIGSSDIELRGDTNNFVVYNGGLQAAGAITASGNISSSGTITANGATFTGNLIVTGSQLITDDITSDGTIRARVKSFDIPHPTRKNKRLVYGALEGPEHGIYCRGESKELKVLLPPEWRAMIDKKGITVQITPIGEWQPLYFKKLHSNWLYFGCGDDRETIHFYWEIKGERTDVPKLETVQ